MTSTEPLTGRNVDMTYRRVLPARRGSRSASSCGCGRVCLQKIQGILDHRSLIEVKGRPPPEPMSAGVRSLPDVVDGQTLLLPRLEPRRLARPRSVARWWLHSPCSGCRSLRVGGRARSDIRSHTRPRVQCVRSSRRRVGLVQGGMGPDPRAPARRNPGVHGSPRAGLSTPAEN